MVFSPGFQSRPDGREPNANLPNTRNEAFEHAAMPHILCRCRLVVAANHVSQSLLASSNPVDLSSKFDWSVHKIRQKKSGDTFTRYVILSPQF